MDTPGVDDNNGLSTPVLFDSDGDGLIDVAYAGDLLGNMWKFDLSAPSSAGWAVAFSGKPLYRACRDDNGNAVYCESGTPNEWQPITSQPQVAKHALGGNFIIFGTGRYITFGDLSDPATQSFYGIWDDGTHVIADRSHLLQQTVTLQTTAFGNDVRSVSTNSVNWASQWGWYLDLPGSPGERVVSKPLIKLNRAIFVTVIPSTDACSPGGDSWLMELDLMSGGAPPTSVFDFNNDDVFDAADEVSGRVVAGIKSTVGISKTPVWLNKSPTISFKIMTGTSGGFMGPKNKGVGAGGGSVERVYWMQIR
jgi:type IV pilus assembly protein PilY1